MEEILYFIAWLLTPIIPAYFCYEVIKRQDSTSVTGRLFGLKIETSGAFAIYFILFLCIHFYFGKPLLENQKADEDFKRRQTEVAFKMDSINKHMWLIKCKLDLVDKDNKTELSEDESNASLKALKFVLTPPIYTEKEDGEIEFYLPQEILNASTATVLMDIQGFKQLVLNTSGFSDHKINNSLIDLGTFKIRKATFATSYNPGNNLNIKKTGRDTSKLPKSNSLR